jgi:hypothetical protein
MSAEKPQPLATAAVAAAAAPSLLTQVGMAGSAAVITVTFIHPIDVIKVGIHMTVGSKAADFAMWLVF